MPVTPITKIVDFEQLSTSDLLLDAIYGGGSSGTMADDPIDKLIPGVGLMGGIRPKAYSKTTGNAKLVVLYTSGMNTDWPDSIDVQTGTVTYYGDNRHPGKALEDTQRAGNVVLRRSFELAAGDASARSSVPPYLLFWKAGDGRSVRFRGLLAPGSPSLTSDEELVAVWRSTGGLRFQNYRAKFTILDVPTVSQQWLSAVAAGDVLGPGCPPQWKKWVSSGSYSALTAEPTSKVRSKNEQLPSTANGLAVLETLREHFADRPTDFERCAVEIWRMVAPAVGQCDVTRPSRDGGRDAIGEYHVGPIGDQVKMEFALEAKCWSLDHAVGIKQTNRLISRIRHRQFGVFITTSYVDKTAYDEIRADGHPIVIMSGGDVVDVLVTHGYSTPAEVKAWLSESYPSHQGEGE